MRSVFFQRPLEYKIEIDGELWNQGDAVSGSILIRNMSSETISLSRARLLLAFGLKKAIKENTEDAWNVLESRSFLEGLSMESGQEHRFEWSFQLPTDCPITDKQGGLYVLFGGEETLTDGGKLNLTVELHPIIQNYLQTFTTQFRFLEKYHKNKSDWTEVKLLPPESREFPNLEQVICFIRIHEEQLQIRYRCKVKGLGRSGESMKVTKKFREIEQSISPDLYLQPGGFPNRSCFREHINEALDITRPEVMF